MRGRPESILTFTKAIVDATGDLACAFKPQIAYFAANRAEDQLEELCAHIRATQPHALLILDAKRGDIGPTAEQYAIEAFVRYGADAVTVNPYLGTDSIAPFLEHRDNGIFVLCRTSNPGGADLQDLDVGGRPLVRAGGPARGRAVERSSAVWARGRRNASGRAGAGPRRRRR